VRFGWAQGQPWFDQYWDSLNQVPSAVQFFCLYCTVKKKARSLKVSIRQHKPTKSACLATYISKHWAHSETLRVFSSSERDKACDSSALLYQIWYFAQLSHYIHSVPRRPAQYFLPLPFNIYWGFIMFDIEYTEYKLPLLLVYCLRTNDYKYQAVARGNNSHE
jgi:hypothetical protein